MDAKITSKQTLSPPFLSPEKQQLGLDMEQQTGSNSGKEYVKDIYCPLADLTSMKSTACEMVDWMKHKVESRLPGKISITSNM